MKKLIKYTAIILGTGASLYLLSIFAFVGMAFFQIGQNGQEVNAAAENYRKELAKITVITGQPTNAKAIPSGDGLTGAKERSYAKAEFTATGTWYDQALAVRQNLEKQSFVTTEKPLETDPADIRSVKQNFYRGNDAIVVEYVFTETYRCPVDQICGRAPGEQTLKPKFDVNTLAQQPIKGVVVRYGNKDHKNSFYY